MQAYFSDGLECEHNDPGGVESNFVLDPLMKYLNRAACSDSCHYNVGDAIKALTTDGYFHIPCVLTPAECDEALGQMWDFVEDVSAGVVNRNDPNSWYPSGDGRIVENACSGEVKAVEEEISEIKTDPNIYQDIDPWPHTGYSSFPDMFQSLGAGFVLGHVREILADRIFEPLFGTRQLLSSKEGFTFCRPLVVELDSEQHRQLIWNPYEWNSSTRNVQEHECHGMSRTYTPLFQVCGKPQPSSEGQHYDQGVPISTMDELKGSINHQPDRNLERHQKLKDLTGLCYIQASVSFTNQSIDRQSGGGHFLCYSNSHSKVHRKLVGGTYRATQSSKSGDGCWVPLIDDEIHILQNLGCEEKRIYANVGDVILWRSDLVHAGVAPTLTLREKCKSVKSEVVYDGPREFRAVGYFSMLPTQAVNEYAHFSRPKRLLKNGVYSENTRSHLNTYQEMQSDLDRLKLESYRTGRTCDHRPDKESWHDHRRITFWNSPNSEQNDHYLWRKAPGQPVFPPRLIQRPRYRLGPAELTIRQAELYGVLPYREKSSCNSDEKKRDMLRAIVRGGRFEDTSHELNAEKCLANGAVSPVCTARVAMLAPISSNGKPLDMLGQDKYLGGMASPCGRYVFGVPGHAKRVIRVAVKTGVVDLIGPEYKGEFKWLRGVEVPASAMGTDDYPSGCCLALPCNSDAGCVLKIDPETSTVSTFISGDPIPNVEEGWLYHGGNLASDGFVYAVPASAMRVMKIDPRLEKTEYIGPDFGGKAKWYGGILGIDGCIYGIPHNANGVLKIDPRTQEVTILAEGGLPDGQWKWHGGLASHDGAKIIGFPNNADSILVIDVLKQRVYLVGNNSVIKSGTHRWDNRYKYLGGALTADGRYAYLFPCDAEHVLRMDMLSDDLVLVGPRMTEGENKFQNGFVARDGCIYGIPQRSCGILRIVPPGVRRWDTSGNELSCRNEQIDVMYCGDGMVSCKDKFEGGVMASDGSIYCIPLRAKCFVKVDPGSSIKQM